MRQGKLLTSIRRRARIEKYRRRLIWAAVLFGAYSLLAGPHGYLHYRGLKHKHTELQQERRLLAARMVDAQQEVQRLQTDTLYIEKVARERYGFAREGERVYKIVSH
jgi:cell division protein FtsB